MDYRDQIKQFMEGKGPCLPIDIAKLLGKETFLAGAMLSEMASKGIIKVSHLKVGSSPLYYLPQHAEKLQQYSENFDEKTKSTYQLLQKEKVLENDTLEPVQRVILQNLKDFATAVTVKTDTETRRFWKWYLLPDEEAKEHIVKVLGLDKKEEKTKEEEEKQESEKQDQSKKDTEEEKETKKHEAERKKETQEEKVQEVSKEKKQESPNITKKEEVKEEVKQKAPTKEEQVEEKEKKEGQKQENTQEKIKLQNQEEKKRENKEIESVETKEKTKKKSYSSKTKKAAESKEEAQERAEEFFKENNITMLKTLQKTDDKHAEYIVEFDTPFGKQTSYCALIIKKRVGDAELNGALLEASRQHLPLVFMTTGKLSKGLVERLRKETKGVLYKEL